MLETKPINIKHLIVPEPERGDMPFDPQKDISYFLWSNVEKIVGQAEDTTESNWVSKLQNAKLLHGINPGLSRKLGFQDKQFFDNLFSILKSYNYTTNLTFANIAAQIRILSPEAADTLIRNTPDELASVPPNLRQLEVQPHQYINLLLAFPQETIVVPDKIRQVLLREIDKNKSEWHKYNKGNRPWEKRESLLGLMKYAAELKILYPDVAADVTIDREIWENGRDILMKDDLSTGTEFLQLAHNMSIAAAKRVVIDQEGIRVIKHEGHFDKESRNLPQVRKF